MRLSHAADWQAGRDRRHISYAGSQHHIGHHAARRHRIDADTARPAFHRRRAHQRDHGRLRCGIQREAGIGIADAADRRVDDDAAAAIQLHGRDLILQAEKHRTDIGVEHGVIDRARLLLDRRAPFLMSGIVEGHIEPSEFVHHGSDETGDLRLIRHVGAHEQRFRAKPVAFIGRRLSFGFAAARDHDGSGAFLRHQQCRRPPDAAAPAGDEADAPGHAGIGAALGSARCHGHSLHGSC